MTTFRTVVVVVLITWIALALSFILDSLFLAEVALFFAVVGLTISVVKLREARARRRKA